MKLALPLLLSIWSVLRTCEAACGYSACHKTDTKKLNIHLIAHSHDDVGWLSTADGYYDESVRQLITNVVQSLQKNGQRKFTQVEIYFFNRWWSEQTQQVKDQVKKLVSTGQLVFTNGGWTVNDEGVAHYNNIIDQLTMGHKFLDETFGECGHPKVSWQIDPFGASREMTSLYAQMAFDGHVLNRGPDSVPGGKSEFVWNASEDLKTQMFSTVLHSHYSAPNGFNFEDGKNGLNEQNKAAKADAFVKNIKDWNNNYGNTNEVLVPMGDDFQYKNAENWFSNMDKLIAEVKSRHSDVDIFYSTPECYIKAANEMNRNFSERTTDYLTFRCGYYANHPSLKYQDRVTNSILQASKQLDVLARLDPARSKVHLDEARNEVAVMTHHDAITGTSPQSTINDYTQRLQSGYAAAKVVVQKAYHYLKDKQKSSNEVFCDSLNITECSLTETNDKIAVTVYNQIARPVDHYLSIPVGDGKYAVYDSKGQTVSGVSVLSVSDAVKHLPERRSAATHELVFKANLPALGFTTYFIEKQKTETPVLLPVRQKRAVADLKGKSFTIQLDERTGAFNSITLNGETHKLKQSFKYYKSVANHPGIQNSDPYQFCNDGAAHDFTQQKLISRQTSGGVHELQQEFSDWVKQTVRTYEDQDYIELDWTVGPIPLDGAGKEIITRFETDFKTDGVFYTDANGRQTMKRKFDPKKTACSNLPIPGNYNPAFSRAAIKDEAQGLEMTILTDRSQGCSSVSDGQLELFVFRRLDGTGFTINDLGVDGKGLIIRGKHYIYFQSTQSSAKLFRGMAEKLMSAPVLSFDTYSTIKDYSSERDVSLSAVSRSLPENIHLLTLENWKQNQVLIRLEHMFESSDGSELAKPVDVDLNGLFTTFKITDAVEMTLSANVELKNSKRLEWKSHVGPQMQSVRHKRAADLKVSLSPQQIRTFVLTVDNNYHKEDKCTSSWVKTTANTIPANALIGGHDEKGRAVNICRHLVHNTDMVAGKAGKDIGCVATFDSKGAKFDEFEVLVANGVEWVARHGMDPMPAQALVIGDKPGGHTYVGRCFTRNGQQIGKIDYKFYYELDGKEVEDCHNHEVLVCPQ